MKKILFAILLGAGGFVSHAGAQIALTLTTYTQNFDLYDGSSTATLPAGWTMTGSSVFKGRGTGSSNAGGIYSYGADSSDGSLGFLHSGGTGVNLATYAVSFTNGNSTPITSLTISFSYEQWRFVNATGWDLSGTGDLAGVSALESLDFTGSATGTSGSVASTPINVTLTGLNIAPGDSFGLSWVANDLPSSDNGISIDDFSIKAVAVPEPSTIAILTVGCMFGLMHLRRRLRA
jgi:hypothetical protein